MAIELFEMSTEEFLAFVSKYPQLGSFSVLDFDDAVDTFPDLRPDDVVIYHDYCTDDIRHSKKEEVFIGWLDATLYVVDSFMTGQGYTVKIDQLDGSGGGLWYGATVYRKV
jgi:hypothetical protein